MEEVEKENQVGVSIRPSFLTVLCFLTFISAGTTSMSSLMTPPFSEMLVEFVEKTPSFDDYTKEQAIKEITAGWAYHFPVFVLSICSLAGAFYMWSLKKTGFHIYSLANLLLLIVPMLVLGTTLLFGKLLFTVSFIGLYATHFKMMK